VQFTLSNGLGGVLSKVAGQKAAHRGQDKALLRSLHPNVQHTLLV
jgi:hypothetical protein